MGYVILTTLSMLIMRELIMKDKLLALETCTFIRIKCFQLQHNEYAKNLSNSFLFQSCASTWIMFEKLFFSWFWVFVFWVFFSIYKQ